ncbi:hypothetical protein [Acidiphilium sp. MT5]
MAETTRILSNLNESQRDFLRDAQLFESLPSIILIRLFYGFQFTMLSMLVAFPSTQSQIALPYISFCILVDFLRIVFIKSIRVAVLYPRRANEFGTIDVLNYSRSNYTGVVFLSLYIASPFFALIFEINSSGDFIMKLVSHFDFISYVHRLFTYGFSSHTYKVFSFAYIVVITIIDAILIAIASTTGIILLNFDTVTKLIRLNGPKRGRPPNVSGLCTMMIVFGLLFWMFQLIVSPTDHRVVTNGYDWAGPFPMALYGLAKWGIILSALSLNRFFMLSLQGYYTLQHDRIKLP